jgi:hypothetical protein
MSQGNNYPNPFCRRSKSLSYRSTIAETSSSKTGPGEDGYWSDRREEDSGTPRVQRQYYHVSSTWIFLGWLRLVATVWTEILHWLVPQSPFVESVCGLDHWNYSRSDRRTRIYLLLFRKEDLGAIPCSATGFFQELLCVAGSNYF